MENNNETKKEKIKLRELRPFLKYYRKYWAYFIPFIALLVAQIVIGIVAPIYAGKLIASFTTNFKYDLIVTLILILAALDFVYEIIAIFINIIWNKLTTNFANDMSLGLVQRYNQIKIASYDQNDTYKMLSRMNGDVQTLSALPWKLLNNVSSLISRIGFITYCYFLSWEVGLIMTVVIILTVAIHFIRIKRRMKRMKIMQEDMEKEGNLRMENIRGIRDVRALNITENIYAKITEQANFNARKRNRLKNKNNIESNVTNIIFDIIGHVAVFLLVLLVTHGRIDIATMIIAYNYKSSITAFAYYLIYTKEEIATACLSAKLINEFYDENKYPTETFGDKELTEVNGNIEFKDVCFAYTENAPVLNNLSFKVEANSMVSFVGKSGAGKSTIISLLDKLYFLNSGQGEILLDDVNINDLTCSSLRNNITIVSQTPYLFNLSVKENLRLAKPDATDAELKNALKQSEMYDDIMSKPDKLDSMLGENGIILSGGQKQRIAIARAILKGSKVIVFDEATSALDNENQSKIKSVIKSLKKDHTIIMIAHRLSTVVDSDKIIYLEEGQVKDQGTHEYLIKNCTEYKNLYKEENS